MAIKSIDVLNVMVFQRQWRKNNGDCKDGQLRDGDIIGDSFRLEFCDGINVLIGENGVGKTKSLLQFFSKYSVGIYSDNRNALSF